MFWKKKKVESPKEAPKPLTKNQLEELEIQFSIENMEYLQSLSRRITMKRMNQYSDFSLYVSAYEDCIRALDELKEFCSHSMGGQRWFSSMYTHCHNSRNRNFSLEKQIRENYKDLIENYKQYSEQFIAQQTEADYLLEHEARIRNQIIDIVTAEQGYIQKNLYSNFLPDERNTVIKVLSAMVKEKVIYRKSYKNTFKLYTDPLKMNDK